MRDLFKDLFTKHYDDVLERWQKEYKENHDCFACKHCLDKSDEYNTYHECEYGGPLPEEHTCLLWEDEDA